MQLYGMLQNMSLLLLNPKSIHVWSNTAYPTKIQVCNVVRPTQNVPIKISNVQDLLVYALWPESQDFDQKD